VVDAYLSPLLKRYVAQITDGLGGASRQSRLLVRSKVKTTAF
jgi:N-methylhydantoinase A/oxoprolinase/acetone carboxylase beta subunit